MKNELESWKWIHQQLTDQIDREFDLLGQRMTWLLTGNAFLFTVTAISIGTKEDALFSYLVPTLIIGTACLGLIISISSYFTMKEARDVISIWKRNRKPYEIKITEALNFKGDITVYIDKGHYVGNLPYYLLPGIITVIWVVIIISIFYDI